MIIDDVHRAAFVHVPKCGGTSVSLQLGDRDSYAGGFRRAGAHPTLGSIHYAHIPLAYLRAGWPEEFEKLVAYQTFALTRDPHARFASAIFQRLEEFGGVRKDEVSTARALAEARHVVEWLADRGPFCDLEFIHFSRQTEFISLEGRPVVSRLFAVEDFAKLIEAAEVAFGLSLDAGRRENTNFGAGHRLLAALRVAKPIYSRLTSWEMRKRLLLAMRRSQIQSPHALYAALRGDPEIAGFVESYYGEDFELHRAALAHPGGDWRGADVGPPVSAQAPSC